MTILGDSAEFSDELFNAYDVETYLVESGVVFTSNASKAQLLLSDGDSSARFTDLDDLGSAQTHGKDTQFTDLAISPPARSNSDRREPHGSISNSSLNPSEAVRSNVSNLWPRISHARTPPATTKVVRPINVEILLQQIAVRGICNGCGPAFSRTSVDEALRTSVVY